MAEFVKIGDIGTVLERRITERLARISPKNPRINEVLTRIGILIETEAKLNIRRKRIIDTGTLLNSIRYRLEQRGSIAEVKVGSFGVPYAAAHEFGFSGPVAVRSFTRIQTTAFGRVMPEARPVTVSAHTRFMRVRARPYLRPALRKHQSRIVEMLREVYR